MYSKKISTTKKMAKKMFSVIDQMQSGYIGFPEFMKYLNLLLNGSQ